MPQNTFGESAQRRALFPAARITAAVIDGNHADLIGVNSIENAIVRLQDLNHGL